MRVMAPAAGCKQMQVGGVTYNQDRTGAFEVRDDHAKAMRRYGECFTPSTRMSGRPGYVCQACGFVAVFKDHCGRCGCTDLVPEEA